MDNVVARPAVVTTRHMITVSCRDCPIGRQECYVGLFGTVCDHFDQAVIQQPPVQPDTVVYCTYTD